MAIIGAALVMCAALAIPVFFYKNADRIAPRVMHYVESPISQSERR